MTTSNRAPENGRFLVGESCPLQRRDYAIALTLFLVACCVYLLTFSPMPTSDGLTEAIRIEMGDPVSLFRAVKLLYQPMAHVLYRLCQEIGLAISPIQLLQTMNALVGSAVVVGFFLLLLRLFGDRLAAVLGSLLLAFSHSFWFYLNGEVHVFSVACLLVAAWVLLTMELRRPLTWILAGVTHGFAILFHLDNIGFGGLIMALLLFSAFTKGHRLKSLTMYACTLIVVVAVPYYLAGRALDPETPPWFYWYDTLLREVVQDHQFISVSSPFAPIYDLVRVAKGQGTAFTIGVDVLADLVRNRHRYAFIPHLLALLCMTAGIIGILVVVLVRAWCHRRKSWRAFRSLIVFCAVWFVGLKIIHYFWAPSLDEYHVTTLPPMIILLVVGLLTQECQGTWRMGRKAALAGGVLTLLIFTTNLVGIVLPWKQFGENVLRTAVQVQEISREDALFITPDSSVNLEYFAGRDVKVLKTDLFEGMGVGLNRLGNTIDAAIAEGRQVFLLRWLQPSEFFFEDYNARNQVGLGPDSFAVAFLTWATDRYSLVPVMHYWEWETWYERYGNRNAVIYRVEPVDAEQSP